MPKKILLIENDGAFASELTRALEDAGFEVRATRDGKDGLDLSRDWAPSAVVLCVELPGMSGYLVCQKLRKDDALHAIPLVLTSAEATPATIENHKKLKVRADAYLLKPYAPEALIDALAELVGLPEREADPEAIELTPEADPDPLAEPVADEELVNLEEEMGLEALPSDSVEDLPSLDLGALPDEPVSPPAPSSALEDDLKLLDDAFEGLSAPPPSPDDALELDFGVEIKTDGADAPARGADDARASHRDALDEADAALGALGDLGDLGDGADEPAADAPDDGALNPTRAWDLQSEARPPVRGASADLLRKAGIKLLDDDDDAPPPARPDARAEREERARADDAGRRADEATRRSDEAARRASDATRRAAEASQRADEAEAQLGELRAELDAAETKAREAAQGLEAMRRRAEDAERRAEEAKAEGRRKADEAAAAGRARAEELEHELETLRTDLLVARNEADGARGEVEKRTAEIRKRVAELEATNAKHEERVVKAYQKIKADEKVREKIRKAIAIAAQLLDEGAPVESASEKDRRAGTLGRE